MKQEMPEIEALERQIRSVVAMSGFNGTVRVSIGDDRKTPDEICTRIEIDGLKAGYEAVMRSIRKTLSDYDVREVALRTELESVTAERNANIEAIKDLRRDQGRTDRKVQELEQALSEKSLLLDDRSRSLEQANAKSQERYDALKAIMNVINSQDMKGMTARKLRSLIVRVKVIAASSPA